MQIFYFWIVPHEYCSIGNRDYLCVACEVDDGEAFMRHPVMQFLPNLLGSGSRRKEQDLALFCGQGYSFPVHRETATVSAFVWQAAPAEEGDLGVWEGVVIEGATLVQRLGKDAAEHGEGSTGLSSCQDEPRTTISTGGCPIGDVENGPVNPLAFGHLGWHVALQRGEGIAVVSESAQIPKLDRLVVAR